MSAPFITLNRTDTNATHAARILSISQRLKTLRSDLGDVIAESFQMFDGNGPEQFTLVKTKYGVSTNAEANTVFDLMNGMLIAINASNEAQLATRIG